MKQNVAILLLIIGFSVQADEFIDKHLVPSELKQILDQHQDDLKQILQSCRKRKHCPAGKAVKEFSWLPGYLVKYGIDRIHGALLLQSIIDDHGFNHVVVPKKYLYKIPGNPEKLVSSNYLVIAEKLEREQNDEKKQITEDMVREFLVLIIEAEMKDHHCNNVFVTTDGKMAMIDTGKESFYPWWVWHKKRSYTSADVFNSIALLIDKHGKFLKKNMVSQEAYWLVVKTLADFIEQQADKVWFNEKIKEHITYVEKQEYQPWDYIEPFRVNGLID